MRSHSRDVRKTSEDDHEVLAVELKALLLIY